MTRPAQIPAQHGDGRPSTSVAVVVLAVAFAVGLFSTFWLGISAMGCDNPDSALCHHVTAVQPWAEHLTGLVFLLGVAQLLVTVVVRRRVVARTAWTLAMVVATADLICTVALVSG